MPQITKVSPDEILKKIMDEHQVENQGHLKIFFGYAAGVGKTYAMLKAAHAAKQHGIDVVAGYIEPHARPETMELLNGIEQMPTLKFEYKGITLQEFDLDATIKRKPQLILVDELAHTNAEGCRHMKRYQDIQELLKAGINVYTTVNVQHIESLNDIVASITGIMVQERIPDHIFDNADQVELVDIEPANLLERLEEGKIYKKQHVQKALNHFFNVDNLVALREIALRRTADRVNRIAEKRKQASKGDFYTGEHILVCLSSSPSNAKIIRTAARMANAFKGNFTALFVETPDSETMTEGNKMRLRNNIRLAGQLGAKIETVYGDDVAFQIAEFARYAGVSKIIVGRTNAKRRLLQIKRSFAEQLTAYSPNLDIYIIPDKPTLVYKAKNTNKKKICSLTDLLKVVIILFVTTLIGFGFQEVGFSEANIINMYILSVLITAVVTSNRPCSILSAFLSVLVFNFFFTHPTYTLIAHESGYHVTFIIMFITAFIIGTLASKIKLQAQHSAQTAYRTKILLETNQLLQQENNSDGIVAVTANQLMKLLDKTVVYYTGNETSLADPIVFPIEDTGKYTNVNDYISDNEKAVAVWVFKNNKHAGASTNTLGSAKCLYLAIRTTSNVFGVIGITLKPNQMLDSFENSLVLSILGECALALEKELFNRKREEAATQAKNEQLRTNLLRSISHDLRTPLTTISGNAAILLNNSTVLDHTKKKRLYADIFDDSQWLINLVENLLSITRIEEGTMNIQKETEVLEEVINEALRHISRKSVEHTIRVQKCEELILAKMDSRLIVQVIINIVDNAIKYTPKGSEIVISTNKNKDIVTIEIADNGNGIPDEAKEKLFDMFYTVNNTVTDSRRGMGIGLALCKSIITAHGGTLSVSDHIPHGTVFQFTLQAEEVHWHE